MVSDIGIDGFAREGFARVRDVFAENFAERGEVGAAAAVYLDGEPVVDLWGGVTVRDGERDRPWQRDTLVCMFSLTKTRLVLCAHRLADQGNLDDEERVATYWREFARPARRRSRSTGHGRPRRAGLPRRGARREGAGLGGDGTRIGVWPSATARTSWPPARAWATAATH